ncbi:zinc finger protein 729-like isoform X1 [Daphnia carinata]|uniref:zinc finger protein 729-like isoform X1 n=1 Tax=Daphnia carinata TaxID=120202 RepID=UPI00257D69AE|nr:zinc finger protein 729-like isoform X1 [Daphnia carinata]
MEFLLARDCNSALPDYLKFIYDNGTTSDVLILSEHGQFKAHKSVLAAASQFFHFVLKDQIFDDCVISFAEYSSWQIQKLLEFIYTGKTTINANEEDSFTSLLTYLEIGGVKPNLYSSGATTVTGTSEKNEADAILLEFEKSSDVVEVPKNLKCEVCGQVLKTRTGLRMHLLVHQGSKGKVFTCDVCGKGFSQASQLKTHMRIHTGEKPYKCNVCEKSFSHASTLSEHKNLHDALKPFQCNVCKQAFAQRKALRSHNCLEDAQNFNLKMFPCPYCTRSFGSRRGLAIHKIHQHAETSCEPILQCDLCSETFTSEFAFETHMQHHT